MARRVPPIRTESYRLFGDGNAGVTFIRVDDLGQFVTETRSVRFTLTRKFKRGAYMDSAGHVYDLRSAKDLDEVKRKPTPDAQE